MRRLLLSTFALALLATTPAAHAAGGPVTSITSPNGVLSPGFGVRYLTTAAGAGTTVIAQDPSRGDVIHSTWLEGSFAVPVVAYDGTAAGVSGDGGTLVLPRPATGARRKQSSFAVLDARRLRLREVVRLRGDYGFDALSPDGSSLFLIRYLSWRDPTKYDVRVYDLERDRLLPRPITDPRESVEEMYGTPVTRTTSADGRWAYTLYAGMEHPFIHALDTQRRRAVCIDLDHLHSAQNLFLMRLDEGPGGRLLRVVDGQGRPRAIVDTLDWSVSVPAAPAKDKAKPKDDEGGGVPGALLVAAAALLAAGAAFLLGRRLVQERNRRARVRVDVELAAVDAALDEQPLDEGEGEAAEVLEVDARV